MLDMTKNNEPDFLCRRIDCAEGLFEAFQVKVDVGGANKVEDVGLAPEIVIDTPFRGPECSGDIIDAGFQVAFGGKQLGACLSDGTDLL